MLNRTYQAFREWLGLFSALRFRDFRLFWIGLTSQIVGQQMYQFTVGWLAFDLTGQPGTLALIHLVGFIPRLPVTIFGGVFADRWDQRGLILAAQGTSTIVMITVAVLALTGNVDVWHLVVSAFVLGISQAIDEPARTAFYPRLLPDRSHIPSAVPLISMAWSSTRVLAPSIGGFIIAAGGASSSFFASSAGAMMLMAALQLVHPRTEGGQARGNMLHNLIDGVRYVRANEVFSKVIAVGFVYAAFSMGYTLTLPVFAGDILNVDSRGLGILTGSAGIGSFFALATFHSLHRRMRPGMVLILGVTLFNGTLIGFALSSSYWLSVALLTVTGAAHIYFQTSANVILQSLVDEAYRGRVMALYGVVWSLLMLSGFLLNQAAEFVGPRAALAGGSSIVLAYVWLVTARSSALRNVSLERRDEPKEASR